MIYKIEQDLQDFEMDNDGAFGLTKPCKSVLRSSVYWF
jgi:hypothetical protein